MDIERRIKAAFSPYSPINDLRLFRGRITQIRTVTDSITTDGLHCIIFGERGVGKTSLANILDDILEAVLASCRVNCGATDSFAGVIRRSFDSLRFGSTTQRPGFTGETVKQVQSMGDMLPANGRLSPDTVADLLSRLPPFVVLVFDEFDRLPPGPKRAFADMIKSLSDRGASASAVLVGVAEDVDELIETHASVQRCLRQVRMPRMSDPEIAEIAEKGFAEAGFTYESDDVIQRIVSVSQGFPHYGHLLAQNAARAAADDGRLKLDDGDVLRGMEASIQETNQTHRDLYFKAVTGTKKQNLWREVVVACALARNDERGYFATRDVQESLSGILGRPVQQQTIAFHLGKLIEDSRGPLLARIGPERRYRYRFVNPLMRPFVLMKAMADGLIRP